jgi:hypothetical protein
MSASSIPDLKRIEFFNGQRLTAQDLTDVQDANRQLRWLHNRSLHGWGIGIGYAVTGEAGDTTVTVSPGYAIDCLGRELILTQPVTIPVPAVAGNSTGGGKVTPATFFLTVSYLDDAFQPTVESRPGVCLPAGTVRLAEGPLVQWQQLKDIQDGMNVILAEAIVLNCQLNAPLGLDVRRNARPAEQPYINAGQVPPAAITWTAVVGGIATRVDTSAAKFAAVPAYFAHVIGPRQVQVSVTPGALNTYSLVTVPIVDLPAPDGFVLQVVMLMFDKNNQVVAVPPTDLAAIIPALNWTIVWMGIEG